jgi:hypothetical protein
MIPRSTDSWRSITIEEWARPDGVKVVKEKDGVGWAVQLASGEIVTGHYGNRILFETDEQACEACDLGRLKGVGATREE